MHNRETIFKLQNAHADYIESVYTQTMRLPGNPDGIEILDIQGTRVFLSNGNSFKNRAIFTGNESPSTLREVAACFERKRVDGFFEINPANFYRTQPFSWKSEMVPALLDLGFHPSDLRCVWYLDESEKPMQIEEPIPIKRFESNDAEELIKAKLIVEPVDHDKVEEETRRIKHSFTKPWTYFIGYSDDRPVSISQLFVKDQIGYLAWGFTAEDWRKQGHHRAHTLARIQHAFQSGCNLAFSVTDFNIPSSLSLQKVGFKLAYNYLLMRKFAASG